MSQENYYKAYYLTDDIYSCLVVCLSYASIYNYLDQICLELNSKGVRQARVLLDQLLITGNHRNRFLSIEYANGMLLPQSAITIEKIDIKYRKITASELKKRKAILHNSILSNTERQLLERGVIL